MTYEQFYYGAPGLVKIFIKADEFRTERMNFEAYWHGLYSYKAFSAVMENFGYQLGGCKGVKPEGYLNYPIPLTEGEVKAEKERKKQDTMAWVMQNQGD